jgi:hypothetical protein
MGQKISEKQMKDQIRSVVRENIKEVTTNDWHFKAIMAIWDKGGSFTRKKIGTILLKDPNANKRDIEDALRNSDYDEVTDVTDRLRIESIITEKQLKGLGGILSNTPLDKISKDQKLKIIKAPGNIIDFIVPKGVSRNFWQVMGTGKVKKNAAGEHYLEGRVIDSPMFKSLDDLIAGVRWDSMEERRRFNESINEAEDNIPGGLAKGMTLNDIAEKHGMSVDMLVAEFKKGIQTEMEHTTDREMAKEITLDHLFEDPQYYTKLATVEEYVDDKGVEHVAAALPQTEEEPLKEATANANILGIDFNISETDFRIFFAFKDKKEASIKVRQIGSNKIVNLIQNSLDKAYGKGEFFFRSGTSSEIKNGYLFQKKENNIDLNKLKFEGVIKEEDYTETPEETLEGLKEMAMGNLERIEDYAEMISDRMKEGQELDSWMYSQLTIALENLNSVHDAMDGIDGVKESVNEYNVNKKFGSKYDIGAGSMGSGTIFWNRAEEEFGDYKKIAHVSDSGRITFYDKKLPSFVKKHVEDYAKTQNESVNEATEPEIISQIKNIAKTHQNNIVVDPKSGKKMRVDAFSASAIATVYDALSDSSKEKFLASGLLGMQQMAMKLLKK